MTTKELTDRLVDDLCSEIPIEFDGDEKGVREEMNAIIYNHVERYRQQLADMAIERILSVSRWKYIDTNEDMTRDQFANYLKESLLNEK